MPKINPDILIWARESAGVSVEEAAQKLGFKDTEKATADEKLRLYEDGDKEPSRSLISKMAKHYKRPLITFYMANPPRKGDRGEDFRTLPDVLDSKQNANVDALIRDIKARQKLVRELVEEDNDYQNMSFVSSLDMKNGVDTVVECIKNSLQFDINEFRKKKDYSSAFTYARQCTESAGVFVLLMGNLGSHHTNIDLKAFRGFALADDKAPFIVINDNDHKGAWSFTLFHELAHVILGRTGVTNVTSTNRIEKFCNSVAAEILLPKADLEKLHVNTSLSVTDVKSAISLYSNAYKISNTMLAYSLFLENKITQKTWNELQGLFRQEFLKSKSAKSDKSTSGPSYYVVRRHRIGDALINFVSQSLEGGDITSVKAAKVLGIKPQNLEKLIRPSLEYEFVR